MLQIGGYIFKRAENPDEIDQIHSLNYRTFVSEIPQHEDTGSGHLVDKFHEKNFYLVALRDGIVLGMVSAHDQPPFSVAERIPDPSVLHQPGMRPLEIRLLAIDENHRNGFVTGGLLWAIFAHARQRGATHLIISGVERSQDLYLQMGFEPLGPPVGQGDARFIPMIGCVEKLGSTKQRFLELMLRKMLRQQEKQDKQVEKALAEKVAGPSEEVCLLPGPVSIAEKVHLAFHQPPIYHRGKDFIALFEKVRATLATLVNARSVAIFNGSGTLANEAIGATLAAEKSSRGIILVNGEFGERLERQARRFGLDFRALRWDWGSPWDLEQVEKLLSDLPANSWIWGVHQESSTGMLNDLPALVRLARQRETRVCVDCISSIGAAPIDLQNVYLASGTSGKSLGAYAGAAVVFADLDQGPSLDLSHVPSYLDLPTALKTEGPRYTFPSSTLCALEAALELYADAEKAQKQYQHYKELGGYIRRQLERLNIKPLTDDRCASPVVTTFAPPGEEKSEDFVGRCRAWGFAIGGQSGYLAERRLVQIATMGDLQHAQCAPLFSAIRNWMSFGSR